MILPQYHKSLERNRLKVSSYVNQDSFISRLTNTEIQRLCSSISNLHLNHPRRHVPFARSTFPIGAKLLYTAKCIFQCCSFIIRWQKESPYISIKYKWVFIITWVNTKHVHFTEYKSILTDIKLNHTRVTSYQGAHAYTRVTSYQGAHATLYCHN